MTSGQAVFLVGGRGSRLGNLTVDTPKPLLSVAGRPFIEHLLDKAVREGFDDLVLLAGYHHEAVEAYGGHWRGVPVSVSVEPEPLDTAGAIRHAGDRLRERFLVVNGDTWFDFDWASLARLDRFAAVVAARHVAPADRYETLTIHQDRVESIRPRAPLTEGLINGGVYRFCREVFDGLTGRVSLERDVLPRLCRSGDLGAAVATGDFIDIGLPASLADADAMLARSGSA